MKKYISVSYLILLTLFSGYFLTSCQNKSIKYWQTICVETWDKEWKVIGYIKIPPDWEMHTLIGVKYYSDKHQTELFEYFTYKGKDKVLMVQSDLMSENRERKADEPKIPDDLKEYNIEWLGELEESEYDSPIDYVQYGELNLMINKMKQSRYYIDINNTRYIVWDQSVSLDIVKLIASSFVHIDNLP